MKESHKIFLIEFFAALVALILSITIYNGYRAHQQEQRNASKTIVTSDSTTSSEENQ